MTHTDSRPNSNPFQSLPLWQTVSLCAGLVLLALPLVALPAVLAPHVGGLLPGPEAVDTAVVGTVLALCSFRTLAPLLGVSLRDVFVRRPGRSTARWAIAGVLVPVAVAAGATVIARGTVSLPHGGVWAGASVLPAAIILALWPAVLEELLVRGYLLAVIGRRWNWTAGIVVTASVFALLHQGHATGPWSLAWYLASTGAAGVLFALVTLSSGNVWNAVALHAGWNTVFGGDVLAFRTPTDPDAAAIVTVELRELNALLGGEGVGIPESPLAALVLLIAAGTVIGANRGSVVR